MRNSKLSEVKNDTEVERERNEIGTDNAKPELTSTQKTDRKCSRIDGLEEDSCAFSSSKSSSSKASIVTARKHELASKAALETKAARDEQRAALESLTKEEEDKSDESDEPVAGGQLPEMQVDEYLSGNKASIERFGLTRSVSKEEENTACCIGNSYVESIQGAGSSANTTEEKGNDVSSLEKEERNGDFRNNDAMCNEKEKDWIAKLFEEENNSGNSVGGEQVLETQFDEYVSDEEADAVGGGGPIIDAAFEGDGLMEFAWNGGKGADSRERDGYVEKVQGAGGKTANSANTIEAHLSLDQAHNLNFINLYDWPFDLIGERMSGDDDSKGDFHDAQSQQENDDVEIGTADAEINDYEHNYESTSLLREERNNNYGKNDMGILASTDLPNATISTTSSTTTTYNELLGLEFAAREHNMQLSEIQMVQSLTLAMEADAHGVAVFKTTDHLNKLQFVPIFSWDHSGKPSVYWQLKEGPPLEKERSQISLRIGGMVKQATCGIQKAFCVKPNMRRRSSREELLGLG